MRSPAHLLLLIGLPLGVSAKTVSLSIYPPEVRLHAGGEGQKVLLTATDDEGVAREVTSEATWEFGGGADCIVPQAPHRTGGATR